MKINSWRNHIVTDHISPPSFFFPPHDLWCSDVQNHVYVKCVAPDRCIAHYLWLIELLERMKVLEVPGNDQVISGPLASRG